MPPDQQPCPVGLPLRRRHAAGIGGVPGKWPQAAPDVNVNSLSIKVDDAHTVSGRLQQARHAFACVILAHGAGAGMTHRFMQAVADGWAER
jgi:hypothetical protein